MTLVIAGCIGIVSLVSYRFAKGQETSDAYQFSRAAQQGKAIAPVTLNMTGKDPETVYIGSYLVNSQLGCNSCHTCPSFKGTNPYKTGGGSLGVLPNPGPINTGNYLGGGVPFPGRGTPFSGTVLAASNLTPDSSGLPGGLTYDEFKSAMQNGLVSTKPKHILLVMPWPVFRNLYENDLYAIYEYLSAVPQAKPGVCSNPGDTGS